VAVRRQVSAPLREFEGEIARLIRLDADNQTRFSSGPGRPAAGSLSRRQLCLTTEGIFFAAYRAFEGLVQDVFLLYCQGKPTLGGKRPHSYLNPKDFKHAEELIQSSMRVLDWTAPDELVRRSELYLKDGYPVKNVLTANRAVLLDMKRIRNHIAHNSRESASQYLKVLRAVLATLPIKPPSVGEFLLMQDRHNRPDYYLLTYLGHLSRIGQLLTA